MEELNIKSSLYVTKLEEYIIFVSKNGVDKIEIYDENNHLVIGKIRDKNYE